MMIIITISIIIIMIMIIFRKSDDQMISVQMRGGPEPMMATGKRIPQF